MFEDIIYREEEPSYNKKDVDEKEFKVLFCSICELYKNCGFAALEECIKEFNEKQN